MKKRHLFTLLALSLMPLSLSAQSHKISGKVTDSKGDPVVGAIISIKNKTVAITDLDGFYTTSINPDDVLSFSYVGMLSQKVKANDQTVLNITLQDNAVNLDDVVVVGYGSMKKRDLSGAVAKIGGDELMKGTGLSSFNQALLGKVSGVVVNQTDGTPGGAISINVRGANSFTTSTQPLYIVDGVPFESASTPTSKANDGSQMNVNALASINPHDIESIEILKDASATAIYGSRGANGVVLITTKKGCEGRGKIEFTSNFSISNVLKKIDVLDPVTYAYYINEQKVNEAVYNGTVVSGLPYEGKWKYRELNGAIVTNTGEYNPSPEDFANPGLRTDEYGNQTMVRGTNWQDEIYHTAASQEYNLNISGSDNNGWWSFSGNYLNQTGVIRKSGYERYILHTNIGRHVKDWLELGMNLNYTNATTDFAKSSNEVGVVRSSIIFPATYAPDVSVYESDKLNWLASNPVVYLNDSKDQQSTSNFFSSSYLEAKITPYLKFRQNLGLGYSSNRRNSYYDRHTSEGKYPKNGFGGQSDSWWKNLTSESLLTFEKTLGKQHSLNAVLGFTYEIANFGSKSISTQNFPTDATEDYNLGLGLEPQKPESDRGQQKLMSLLARVNYSYGGGKYIATASIRRDGSSKFSQTNNKIGHFLSGALAWRLSEEQFIKQLNFFDNLKLRLSYGQTGNQGIGAYQARLYMVAANYPYNGTMASGFSEVSWRGALNKNLKWETTDQWNLGLDMSIFRGKVNLTADLYWKKTRDLLQSTAIPSSNGFVNRWSNEGYVVNKGLELSGKFYPISTKDFSWTIDANISFNANHIGGLSSDRYAERVSSGMERIFIQRNGYPIGSIYGFVEDGFYDNEAEARMNKSFANMSSENIKRFAIGEIKYKDLDGDHEITDNDRTIIGKTTPDYTFGITNSFSWKGFSLSFFLQGSVGNDLLNANLRDVRLDDIGNIPRSAYESRWTPETAASAYWPKNVSSRNRDMKISDRYVEDASYLRLKNLNFGYNFKPHGKGVSNIYVYASATNLFTITGYSGMDPDVNAFGWDASRRGVDFYCYPSSRTFSIGFKLDY
jgi:hypothetical protein